MFEFVKVQKRQLQNDKYETDDVFDTRIVDNLKITLHFPRPKRVDILCKVVDDASSNSRKMARHSQGICKINSTTNYVHLYLSELCHDEEEKDTDPLECWK